jgi:hypothetical protein
MAPVRVLVADPRPTTQLVPLDDEPIVDLKALGNYAGFLKRSLGRRRSLVVSTFLTVCGVVLLLCVVMPRVYKISVRVLTHRSLVMAALVHPDRSIPQSADAPTLGAVELIKSRENLENLISDTKLEETWERNRSALWKGKDKLLSMVGSTPSEQDKHESFLKLLDDRVVATVLDEVVAMDVEWPDAEIAMKLSEAALARFLKIRHDMELSEVLETVTILERNVESSRQGIEEVVARMQKIVDAKEHDFDARGGNRSGGHRGRRSRVIAIRRPSGANRVDAGVEGVRQALAAKQAIVAQMKRALEARVAKEQEELTGLRQSLGPDHPDFIEQKRKAEEAAAPPPELVQAQQEEVRLAAQLSAMPAASHDTPAVKVESAGSSNPGEDADLMRVPVSDELYAQLDKDPEIASVMEEIKKREDAHDELLNRLANARIESETANVAFEYRYITTQGPVFPKKFTKPNLVLFGVGGVLVALMLGLVLAVVADLQSNKILESWQIERFLQSKVLGEVEEL